MNAIIADIRSDAIGVRPARSITLGVAIALIVAVSTVFSAPGPVAAAESGPIVLNATGAPQTAVAPAGATGVRFAASGGGGGNGQGGDQNGAGGVGAVITGSAAVSPGTVVTVNVGGQGEHWDSTRPAPSNQGGWGGTASGAIGGVATDYAGTQYGGGGGGGATTLWAGADLLLIAAGGGGGGAGGTSGWDGGNGGGGGAIAQDGFRGHCPQYGDGGHGGQALTEAGARGGEESGHQPAGGGGGGFFGGQGGHSNVDCAGGGGAGSSIFDPGLVPDAAISSAHTPDDGSVTITWILTGQPDGDGEEPPPGSVVLPSIGETQTVQVPAGVTAIGFSVIGGGGGNGTSAGGVGGRGALVSGTVAVTPGDTLTVDVGGQGGHFGTNTNTPSNYGGWGGQASGGNGGTATASGNGAGGGGGGASSIAVGGQIIAIGGGGGGGGSGFHGGDAGSGGTTAQDGFRGDCAGYGDGGHGGWASTGVGTDGGIGSGSPDPTGGGGGGGLLGGQGGHGSDSCSGGGGAGSSMFNPDLVVGGQLSTWGSQSTGWVSISWVLGATLEVAASSSVLAPGDTVTFAGRLIGPDGSDLGAVPHLRLSSGDESDDTFDNAATVGKVGTRTMTATVPGSTISTTLTLEVRMPHDGSSTPPPVPTTPASGGQGAADSPQQGSISASRLAESGGRGGWETLIGGGALVLAGLVLTVGVSRRRRGILSPRVEE